MKKIITVFLLLSISACAQNNGSKIKTNAVIPDTMMERQNIYQFKVTNITGASFDFSTLKGKKILIVNTASECGLTPQYEQLEEIYKKYSNANFVIVGFPANNFGSQEPGSNLEIATFCTKNFGVTFPMMEKISVKGNDMHPLYQFLTQKSKNGLQDSQVAWNFHKYLIDKEGHLEKVIHPKTLPNAKEIIEWIENK